MQGDIFPSTHKLVEAFCIFWPGKLSGRGSGAMGPNEVSPMASSEKRDRLGRKGGQSAWLHAGSLLTLLLMPLLQPLPAKFFLLVVAECLRGSGTPLLWQRAPAVAAALQQKGKGGGAEGESAKAIS